MEGGPVEGEAHFSLWTIGGSTESPVFTLPQNSLERMGTCFCWKLRSLVLEGEEWVCEVSGEEEWDRGEVKGTVSGEDLRRNMEDMRRIETEAIKVDAMCHEKRMVIHSVDRAALSFPTRKPPCINQVPWTKQKKVLQNLTSLLSNTTSKAEDKEAQTMTRTRRRWTWSSTGASFFMVEPNMTAEEAKARLRMKDWTPSGRTE